jgi:protein ImuB
MPKSRSHPAAPDPSPSAEGVAALLFDPWPLYVAYRLNPGLPQEPVAVTVGDRVVALSPAARKAGVSPGMRGATARARLAGLHLVPLGTPLLQATWETLLEEMPAHSPWVEPLRPGRVLLRLDPAAARALAEAYGVRVGFSGYREVALLAALSAYPGQVRAVPRGEEKGWTDRLPLYLLKGLGLGAHSLEWLGQLGQRTLGDLRQWSAPQLERTLPEYRVLQPYLWGPWSPRVGRARIPETLRAQHTFAEAAREPLAFEPALGRLGEQLSAALGRQGKAAFRLTVRVRAGGRPFQAARQSKVPLQQPGPIYRLARRTLEDTGALGLPLQQIALELSDLRRPGVQGALWESRPQGAAARAVAERFPGTLVRVRELDPYALAADQQAVWVRVVEGGP